MTKPTIVVERVPLEYRPVDIAPNFPPMPVLYLELIENKDKVKPELRDKASQPIYLPEKSPELQPLNNNMELIRRDKTPEIYKPPVPPPTKSIESIVHSRLKERMRGGRKSESKEKSPIVQDHQSIKDRRLEEERDREKYASREKSDRDERQRDDRMRDDRYDRKRDDKYERQRDERQRDERQRDERQRDERQRDERQRDEKPREEKYEEREKSTSRQTKQIRDLLGDTKAAVAPIASSSNLPPTLEQITSNEPVHVAGKQVKDVTYTAQDEVERRRDLMFRFDILKKSYKEAAIPEISQFMDVETLDKMYQDTVRRVALDSKVEGYRRFLNMGFMGIELLFSNVLKLDMTGFAKQQMMSMNSYERILIELGEKSLLDKTKSQWPAEVRLMFTIVMNAVIFVMGKAVMGGGLSKVLGGGGGGGGGGGLGAIGGLMSGLMGAMGGGGMGGMGGMEAAPAPQQQEAPKAAPRKMRGPSTINIDELGSKKTN
jgi:hypothetical protein